MYWFVSRAVHVGFIVEKVAFGQVISKYFLLHNQPDALISQIYSVIKLYMFWASSLPIVRSVLLYFRHW